MYYNTSINVATRLAFSLFFSLKASKASLYSLSYHSISKFSSFNCLSFGDKKIWSKCKETLKFRGLCNLFPSTLTIDHWPSKL